jgi:glycosyltransferase involved in cell wall biosynthesis
MGIPAAATVVGTVSRLEPEKAVHRLVDAIASLPEDVHLVIRGDGSMRNTVVAFGKERLGTRFHYFVPAANNEDVYAAIDVFALASDVEGYPLVLLEAAFRGLPAIATRVGSAHEIIEDSLTGILVEPGNRKDLVEAMMRLCSDPGLRIAMGRTARCRADAHFSARAMAEQFEALLDA